MSPPLAHTRCATGCGPSSYHADLGAFTHCQCRHCSSCADTDALVQHMRLMWLASGLQGALQPLVIHSMATEPHMSRSPLPLQKLLRPATEREISVRRVATIHHCEEAVYRDMKCDDVHLPDCSNAIACLGCAAPKGATPQPLGTLLTCSGR